MKEQPENLVGQELGSIKNAWKKVKSAISRTEKKEEKPIEFPLTGSPEPKHYKSFGEYMQAEGQERMEGKLTEKCETELRLAEKDLVEFRETAKKYSENENAADRESYKLHLALKEDNILQLKKMLGIEK